MESKKCLKREVLDYIFDERLVARHMVFLAGPRQVGKTYLARAWLTSTKCTRLYFNWDDMSTRQKYLSDSRFFESAARTSAVKDPWIVFDEIHKRNKWKDILKGAYDVFADDFRFLITGSARLDLFRKSGDSLIGRYNLFNMMPLCIREAAGDPYLDGFLSKLHNQEIKGEFADLISMPVPAEYLDAYNALLKYGPFPEPFLKQNDRFCRKWHMDYISLLIRDDLRDISRVIELDKIEHLVSLLPGRITSPLSMANLANELEVAHTTVKQWLEQLKRLYLIFPVKPWSKKVSRGLKKEKKWYFLDWYYAPEGAARLENLVASCLYRSCKVLTDQGYGDYQLRYIRTLDKKEIDFVICRDNIPVIAFEVKKSDMAVSKTLLNRQKWLPDVSTIGVQLVDQRNVLKQYNNHTWIMSVERMLGVIE